MKKVIVIGLLLNGVVASNKIYGNFNISVGKLKKTTNSLINANTEGDVFVDSMDNSTLNLSGAHVNKDVIVKSAKNGSSINLTKSLCP